MAEPTVEERARLLSGRLGRYASGWLRLKPQVVIDAMNQQQGIIVSEIRAAVAAQKEKDAKIAENWEFPDGGPMFSEAMAVCEGVATAIRAEEE